MGGLMIIGLRLSGDWWSYYQDISIQSIQFQHVPAALFSLKIFWATAVVGDHPPESSAKHDSFANCIPISISAFPYFCRPHTHTCCPIDLLMKDPNKSSQILNPSWNCRSDHPEFLLVFWVLNQQLKLKFETKKDQANRCHSVYKKPGVGPQMSATFLPHPLWLDYW